MKIKKVTQCIFKLWLILYRFESFIWYRYSHSFTEINGGKDFPEYHQIQPYTDDIPF
ncbi:MAG: hypothetical protein MIO92_02650 [Methanosarcinaceae archaeon]|nr:hypothetical protein [Methanosarcinaceae archaeon]